MNQIPSSIVKKTWKEIEKMSPSKIKKLMDVMAEEQPIILTYLLAVSDKILNEKETALFVYLGFAVYQMMLQGTSPLPAITEEILDEIEERNEKFFESLSDSSDSDTVNAVIEMATNYNQNEILTHIINILMEECYEESSIREENIGIMLLCLKTVIDCFDK